MKISWLIQNRRKRRESPRVSLFPFLAVLICTMGALVLLLLTVTRQARLQAAKAAAANDSERAQALQSDLDMAVWRVEQLKKSRGDTEQQLAEARLVLGHLEDHDRRLRQQLTDLTEKRDRAGASLESERAKANSDAKALVDLEAQLVQAERNLAMAAQKAGQQKHGYSIVPYNGPNQTRRRPIYIECTGDAVTIQPEGVSFTDTDFDGPLGPGNPLAAAVRAAREYMLLQSRGMPGAGEPYPLLLVRPTGIAAYEAAMAAMQSWGSEFGYEFVNNDWNLAYPPPDPGLARTMNDAVAIARAEHDRLIAAAPAKYGKRPRPGAYRAHGGDDGSGGESTAGGSGSSGGQSNTSSPGFYASHPAGHAGQGHGFGSGDDDGGSAGNGSGSGSSNGGPAGNTYGRVASLTDHNPYASMGAPGAGGPNIGAVAYGGGGYPGGTPGGYQGGGNGNGTVGYQGGGGGYPGGGYAGGGSQGGMYPGGGGAGGGYPGGTSGSPGGAGFSGNGAPGSGPMGSGGQGNGGPGSGGPNSGGTGAGSGNPNGNPGTGGDGQNSFASGGGAAGGSPGGQPNGQPGLPGISSQFGSNGSNVQPTSQAASQGGSSGVASGYGQSTGGQSASAADGPPPPTPEGYLAGRPNDGQQRPPPPTNVTGGQVLGPLRPGEYRPVDDTPPKKLTPEEEEKLEKDKRRLADKQDADWGAGAPRAAAISRPVHVDCYADRLVIVPEAGEGRPMVIALGPQSERTVDAMIVDVWQLIDVWGIAGSNMYWRPVMQFYVAPGAESRYVEVARMMDGSGLKIERKQ